MFFSFGSGSTQTRIMKELFSRAVGCGLRMSMVSGVESSGKVLFQSHSLGTWPRVTLISLSFAQCVVCACTDVVRGCEGTAINFQHLSRIKQRKSLW